jgi:Kef-type K+ transport system membrane component KefB
LGELLAGVALGSLPPALFWEVGANASIDILSRLGVLILLFEVGVECTVRGVLEVGASAARVALLGTVGSFAAGWAVSALLLPGAGREVHVFLGASITATSVGITARVLKDLGRMQSKEARTILGAAVLDDIMALVVLALVNAWITRQATNAELTPASLLLTVVKTLGFLALAVVVGMRATPRIFALVAGLRTGGALLATGLAFCFLLSWAAHVMGLAPLIGAFAAGLVLEDYHSARFVARGERSLAQLLEPISGFLVPIFFVVMGIRADLRSLFVPGAIVVVVGLTVAAIAGKLAAGLGPGRGVSRLGVAAGMMPRGEVTLIFASLGTTVQLNGTPVIDTRLYSVLIAVVILTTLLTPLALKRSLPQKPRDAVEGSGEPKDCERRA